MKYLPQIFLTFLFLLMLTPHSFTQNANDFNGWEFLAWSWSKERVEKVLMEKGIRFDPGHPNAKGGPTTEFDFQGMKTRLAYDEGHLYDVQQDRDFREEEKEKAEALFLAVKNLQVSRYGEPDSIERDEERKRDYYQWNTKYNVIKLSFSHCETCSQTPGMEGWAYNVYLQTNDL
jgi:hypothetical protein